MQSITINFHNFWSYTHRDKNTTNLHLYLNPRANMNLNCTKLQQTHNIFLQICIVHLSRIPKSIYLYFYDLYSFLYKFPKLLQISGISEEEKKKEARLTDGSHELATQRQGTERRRGSGDRELDHGGVSGRTEHTGVLRTSRRSPAWRQLNRGSTRGDSPSKMAARRSGSVVRRRFRPPLTQPRTWTQPAHQRDHATRTKRPRAPLEKPVIGLEATRRREYLGSPRRSRSLVNQIKNHHGPS